MSKGPDHRSSCCRGYRYHGTDGTDPFPRLDCRTMSTCCTWKGDSWKPTGCDISSFKSSAIRKVSLNRPSDPLPLATIVLHQCRHTYVTGCHRVRSVILQTCAFLIILLAMSKCGEANSVPWGAASTECRGASFGSVPILAVLEVWGGGISGALAALLGTCRDVPSLSISAPVETIRSWSDVLAESSLVTPDELPCFFSRMVYFPT